MTRVRGVDLKGRTRDTDLEGLGLHFKFMKGYERMYSGVSRRRCRENDEPRSKVGRGQGLLQRGVVHKKAVLALTAQLTVTSPPDIHSYITSIAHHASFTLISSRCFHRYSHPSKGDQAEEINFGDA